MGIYSIMDEIAQQQVTKTEIGDNRIFGVLVGVVTNNYDKDMPGRVCVSIPVRDKDANELKWARVAMPSSGKTWGHYFLPEVGDQVLVVFEQGNIERPYIIGCIPKDADKFLSQSHNEKNEIKRIVTTNGNHLTFLDKKDDQGQSQDKITMETAETAHRFVMDNDKKQIILSDKEGNNEIEILTEKGVMNVKAQKKLVIEVGDQISITCASDGSVSIKCKDLKVEANNGIDLKANSTAKLEGGTVSLKATTSLKLESSGIAQVSGAPVKIG